MQVLYSMVNEQMGEYLEQLMVSQSLRNNVFVNDQSIN